MLKKYLAVFALVFVLSSCGSYFNQPIVQEKARIGEQSRVSEDLKNLPLPDEPVVVGVYNFKDQTGQYKNIETGSSFSTAVTQGGTSILLKALEDSKWFTTIERENLSNLLNERNIIRSTRQEYTGSKGNSALPPLLYAGVLLEGGIVSYDTNIITGGAGARYFGVGGSTQYRQDRITVYLRAISTSSGKILKTVYVSKTILSQKIDASLFRYVNFQRLLEVETGFTKNEPIQLAVKEAVDKAVESLIVEGIEGGLWQAKNQNEGKQLVEQYNKEKIEEENTGLYERHFKKRDSKNAFSLSGGVNSFNGDYGANYNYFFRGEYRRSLTPYLALGVTADFEDMKLSSKLKNKFGAVGLNAQINILPYDKLSPYLYAGGGLLVGLEGNDDFSGGTTYSKIQFGAGLKYYVSDRIDIKLFAEQNVLFSDEVDRVAHGKYDDYYFNFGLGVDFYFGSTKNQKEVETETVPENKRLDEFQAGESAN